MRRVLLVPLMAAAACSDPLTVPEIPVPDAVADVGGQVLKASGAPVMAGSVTIRCDDDQFGGAAAIDAQGHYHTTLATSRELLGGERGTVQCVFTAPAGIHAERAITFGPPGEPHDVQIVDLREA